MPIYELDLMISAKEELLKERERQAEIMRKQAEQERIRNSIMNPQTKKF